MSSYPPFDKTHIIIDNYRNSQKVEFIPDKFRSLYSSFNTWLNLVTNKDTDRDKLEFFKENKEAKNAYFNALNNKDFLLKISPLMFYQVLDARLHPKPPIYVDTLWDFSKIVDVIYRVRCNLVHGGKSTSYKEDYQLIELSYYILEAIFVPLISDIINKS